MLWPNHRKSYGYLENEMLMYNLLHDYQNNYYDFLDADEFLQYSSNQMPQFVDYVEKHTIHQEKEDLWFDMRIGRITSSTIYEVSKCRTPDGNLVDRILGRAKPAPESYLMKRGINLQKQVTDIVSKQLNAPLSRCGFLLDPRRPATGASPDALGPNFVVEIKCPVSRENFENYLNTNKNGFLKPKYYLQIQLQMYVKRFNFGYFVMAHPDFESTKKVDIIKIDYNHAFIKKVIKDAMHFWKANIYPEMLLKVVQ